jgi:hypothetical protein
MGEIAARTLLNRIEEHEEWVPEISIEPEFVVRNSTRRAVVRPLAHSDGEDALTGVPIESRRIVASAK